VTMAVNSMIARNIVLLLLLPALALAQGNDLRLPISLDADSTDYDGKNSMLMFRGLRLSQGTTNIEADVGRASKLDFKDSVWHFSGNVIIDVDAGHIECETAALSFRHIECETAALSFTDTQLRTATIKGSPATFELRQPESDEIIYAQAGNLQYDLIAGVIEFSDEAIITEQGNQISSSFLVYNIKEQRISAQSSADGEQKVKITVIPGAAATPGDESTVPDENASAEEPTP